MYNSSLDSGRGNFVTSEHSESGDPDESMEHSGRNNFGSDKPASTAGPLEKQQPAHTNNMKDDTASNECLSTTEATPHDPVTEAIERRQQCRDISCYDVDEAIIGEGTYGQVRVGVDKQTGEKVALKKIKPEGEKDGFPITAVREIKALKALGRHRHVIELKEIATSKATEHNRLRGDVYMVFEYAPYDLSGIVRRPGVKLSLSHVRCYIYQLLEGLQVLHSYGYLHRDLKGANLLINEENVLKIADFGLVKNTRGYYKSNRKLTSKVCTLWYRAPEQILQKRYYDGKADLWAVGVILAELLNDGKPIWGKNNSEVDQWRDICRLCGTPSVQSWPGLEQLMDQFKLLKVPYRYERNVRQRFANFDRQAMDLVDKLLVMDPNQRISVSEALDHSFFWGDPLFNGGPPDPKKLDKFDFTHAHDLEWHGAPKPEAQHQHNAPQPGRALVSSSAARKPATKRPHELVVGSSGAAVPQNATGSTSAHRHPQGPRHQHRPKPPGGSMFVPVGPNKKPRR
eukprot:gb/GECG01009095.1/.p1 GENE.gb/GECG01009095.1/~~gb/GECG01009095.1/.p1  ORF type:complete len:513 (+),score=51.47 gb/GECG01009095.1/:1-1539(+)